MKKFTIVSGPSVDEIFEALADVINSPKVAFTYRKASFYKSVSLKILSIEAVGDENHPSGGQDWHMKAIQPLKKRNKMEDRMVLIVYNPSKKTGEIVFEAYETVGHSFLPVDQREVLGIYVLVQIRHEDGSFHTICAIGPFKTKDERKEYLKKNAPSPQKGALIPIERFVDTIRVMPKTTQFFNATIQQEEIATVREFPVFDN